MATSPSTPTGGVAAAAYKPAFRLTPEKYTSLNDLLTGADDVNKPEVRDLLIKSYGDQGITGFLKLTGALKNAGKADQIEYFEEGRRHRALSTNQDLSAVAAATATLTDSEIKANVQQNDVLMDPATAPSVAIVTPSRGFDLTIVEPV